jgi:hypothetical protein
MSLYEQLAYALCTFKSVHNRLLFLERDLLCSCECFCAASSWQITISTFVCTSCDCNQDKVVSKSVNKVQIIIPDSNDEEPNSNRPSPLPKQKDVGSSKTKVTTINKLTLFTDDLSRSQPQHHHPRSRSWRRTGHAVTPRQKQGSPGQPSTPWNCTPCLRT